MRAVFGSTSCESSSISNVAEMYSINVFWTAVVRAASVLSLLRQSNSSNRCSDQSRPGAYDSWTSRAMTARCSVGRSSRKLDV